MSDVAFEQSFEPLPALFADFCALLRSVSPQDESAPVPGLERTAREVGVHVVTVVRLSFGLVVLALDAGTLRVDDQRDAARTPDHVILVPDAAAFTLQFPYRRASLQDPSSSLSAAVTTDVAVFSRIRLGSRLLALGHRRSELRSTWLRREPQPDRRRGGRCRQGGEVLPSRRLRTAVAAEPR